MQQETAGGVALLPRPRPVTARMQPRPPCSLLILPHLLVRQAWLSARRGGFFGGDAVSEVGGGSLTMKLRPSRHSFLPGGLIAGADSVSEALEGLCNGAVWVKRRGGSGS